MILLSDNDILIKLSQCDLVDEFLTIYGCTINECRVLNEARFSLFLNNPDKCIAKRVGSSAAYDRLYQLVMSCATLGAADEDLDFLEELSQIDHIDPGEQALLLHANNMHKTGDIYYLATGDRKALLGIHNSASDRTKNILIGRVDCTESLILKFIGVYGFDIINGKISSAAQTTSAERFDDVLRMAFGSHRDQTHATECLKSYLAPVSHFICP